MARLRRPQDRHYIFCYDRPPKIGTTVMVGTTMGRGVWQQAITLVDVIRTKKVGKLIERLVWAFKCPTCLGNFTIETILRERRIDLHCSSCITRRKLARANKLHTDCTNDLV